MQDLVLRPGDLLVVDLGPGSRLVGHDVRGRGVSLQLQMFVQPSSRLHLVDAKATACESESAG